MKLWQKVTIGLLLGILCGFFAKELNSKQYLEYIKPIGDIFINMIKMIVMPLIYLSIVSGVTSISDSRTLGRIGLKSTFAFMTTTAFAILIGLTVSSIIQPGVGITLNFDQDVDLELSKKFDFVKMIVSIVPSNIFETLANGDVLQIVFFAIFTGITLNKMGEHGKKIISGCQVLAQMVFKMIEMIMQLSPYGAFALTSWVVGTQGVDVLNSLIKLVFTVIVAMLLQYIIFGLLIYIFAGLSPMPFYRKSFEYQALAFSTSSSKATLSTTMKICRDKLGISKTSTSFVLPLGASINMDGMAIYLGICAVFFAQATGYNLTLHDYFIVIITSTLGCIGVAGIPGGSMVMLPMVLSSIGMPIEGVALIAGIDRILDMLRTTINITGDATITLLVDKSENMLNTEIYNSTN
ncbi:dicarboxylate/amino acid:cation symporter [Rickettsiales endosymbiont of Stachyamoeba lipophora]|uniref:dicarboxylate/amino acid:cation symporter n=1 Tax=Rickettsiales endosymbiont of Stachyamoeba lipophora TaxID=2486578 RepID=UPI000F649FE6|nr:dicarboxylate/amino acid:cation symporter [Rickettsiales endosymbiont of Stachyamoeba lipophora]AZL15373.1 dicarboxylate/amino acid:cation symporter [Rickettsiales endosymbiont of Stachyamoeba lipophora]